MKEIIIYPISSGVAVIFPSGEIPLRDVIGKDVPSEEYKVISVDDLPDAYFRSAWLYDNNLGITIDINSAKEIQRNKWREARINKFSELDLAFMRAIETNDTNKQLEIASKKQALRDVTLITLPDDLTNIKATWPEILGNNSY
jgi:hypothetical protein